MIKVAPPADTVLFFVFYVYYYLIFILKVLNSRTTHKI